MSTSLSRPRLLAGAVIGLVLSLASADVAVAQTPASPAEMQQHARAGERALSEGRYADAEAAFERLRQLSPATAEIHARLGVVYFQQGKFSQAAVALREAIRLKPGLPRVHTLLALSLSELGQYEDALPALTREFSQPADPVLQRMSGLHLQRIYTGLGRDADAVEVALRLSRLHPDDPEVLYHSGRIFANFAYVQTMRLASVAPDSVWLHLAAGEANQSQGLYDAAIREYRQVIAAAPRRPGVRLRLGRALLERSVKEGTADDAVEARRAFEEELALDATNANAAYELAEMRRKAGELEAARQLFEQAVTSYPEFDAARVGLGRTLISLGRPAESLDHLFAAIAGNPANEVAHYQLAQAYRALGNTAEQEKALNEFNRLRALHQPTGVVPELKRDVTPQLLDPKAPE
jgi:tetratricopeptide (TPR) repeat protein